MTNRRDEYKIYLTSEHWQKLRQEAKAKHGCKCQHCFSGLKIDVHHVEYRNWIDCTVEDLMVLCRRCHSLVHKSSALIRSLETAGDSAQKAREVFAYLKGCDAILDAAGKGKVRRNLSWRERSALYRMSRGLKPNKLKSRIQLNPYFKGRKKKVGMVFDPVLRRYIPIAGTVPMPPQFSDEFKTSRQRALS